MKKFVIAAVSASIVLGGCATASKDVATSYISPMQYQSYDCDQILTESQRVQSRVTQLGGRLDQAAANDQAIGVAGALLFWPALFFLGGTKTQEAEYGRLKGEYDGLQQTSIAKKCSGLGAQSSPSTATLTSTAIVTTSDVEKRIELLNDLRSKGILSEDEYKAKRSQLLDAALANTVQSSTSKVQGAAKTDQRSTTPPTVATNIGLRAGDRLTFQDYDSVSGAELAKTTLLLDSVSVDRLSFNGGDIVTARDGKQIKGSTTTAIVYGHNRDGTNSTGKFRVAGFKTDQDMNLTAVGPETMKVANREIRVMRYKIDGYSSSENPNRVTILGNGYQFGSPVLGEMLVDSSSGIVVKLETKSRYYAYQISRTLVDISN